MSIPPHLVQTTLVVAAATAAEVESRSGDVELLCWEALELSRPEDAHLAAFSLSQLYLRRVPSPSEVLVAFPSVASGRFPAEVMAVGASYLRVASLPEGPVAREALHVLVGASRSLGELSALRGAVAASWWSLVQAAQIWGTDPLSDMRMLCLELSGLEGM